MLLTELENPPAAEGAEANERDVPGASVAGRTGTVVGFTDGRETPLVVYEGQPGTAALRARTAVDPGDLRVGGEVALMFDGGCPDRPIVIGRVWQPGRSRVPDAMKEVQVEVDGGRTVVTAREQLVFRCGAASITLTRAGKVLVQGTYVSTRASGVNRVQGGSVQIN